MPNTSQKPQNIWRWQNFLLKFCLYASVCFLGVFAGFLVVDAGLFNDAADYNTEHCEVLIQDIPGPEDFALSDARDIIYISSFDRHRHASGAIYKFNINTNAVTKMRIEKINTDPSDEKLAIYPHGIGYFMEETGGEREEYLFIVSHDPKGSRVMRAVIDGDTLHIDKEYVHEDVNTPNDVVPFNKEYVFVSNDHFFHSALAQKVENYSRIALSRVFLINAEQAIPLPEAMHFANGLAIDSKRTKLLVSAMLGKKILVYDLDPVKKNPNPFMGIPAVAEPRRFATGAGDNIFLTEDVKILSAEHLNLFKLAANMKDFDDKSPSRVVAYDFLRGDGAGELGAGEDGTAEPGALVPQGRLMFESDAAIIGSASIAVLVNDKMIIGSVFDNKVVACSLPQ